MNKETFAKSTALLPTELCPCQSGLEYEQCCGVFHQHQRSAQTAEQLMRSRYCAYVLQNIPYIVETTLPAQQPFLAQQAIRTWAESVQWQQLVIVDQRVRSTVHENIEFKAFFIQDGIEDVHHETSLFVKCAEKWYFLDHTLPLPTLKKPCICGSGKKFKHCCGAFL
ncbi:YchJ family protein [Conservatibacter flavescens]|uniref:SEC-C motif-containing protein n=1 Tax=Conservatibacter flavescens TaxID=28161 RepID=A0A2M8S1L3_9PAST|nr:YchJ family protein [Conservatibacter flavescens]PJG84986.1 SEC-C motif-containing protein [Conservatibacter flavescens]